MIVIKIERKKKKNRLTSSLVKRVPQELFQSVNLGIKITCQPSDISKTSLTVGLVTIIGQYDQFNHTVGFTQKQMNSIKWKGRERSKTSIIREALPYINWCNFSVNMLKIALWGSNMKSVCTCFDIVLTSGLNWFLPNRPLKLMVDISFQFFSCFKLCPFAWKSWIYLIYYINRGQAFPTDAKSCWSC